MGVKEYGRQQTALQWARSGTIPQFLAIGSGSGTTIATLGSLYAEVSDRTLFNNRDQGTAKQMKYSFSKSSTAMSGIFLREFGIAAGSVVDEQDLFNGENFTAVEFDGTIEAEFEIILETF